MYRLTPEQIEDVEGYLRVSVDFDESEKIGHTFDQLKELYRPYFGDAPFEFEDIFITNPLLDTTGRWLGSYEKACDFYGEELVNEYFGKLISTHWKEPVVIDTETIIEAAVDRQIPDKPIYKDNDVTIYNFKDLDKLDELVHDDIDIGNTRGNFLLITSADNADDDFVSEGEDMWVVDLESALCWSNNGVESIDGLRNNALSAQAWAVIDDLLKNETLYDSCGLKDKSNESTFSADIKWLDLKDDFREVKSNNRVETIPGLIALDILNGDYTPEIYFESDFIDGIIDDISEENLKNLSDKFNLSEEEIKKSLDSKADSVGENGDKCWRLVSDSLYNTLYNSEYNNLLEDVYKGIKECFPAYFTPYLDFDSEALHIKNCPKHILSRVMNDYIEQQEQNDWIENIYSGTNLSALIGGLIALNLFIKERYSYQDYDKDEFNDMIDTLIWEQ